MSTPLPSKSAEKRASSKAATPKAPVKSMTGFAQVRHQFDAVTSFALSLKSVNHRYLDLHLRMPAESDALEMKLRRALKERLARGHVELTLTIERSGGSSVTINKDLVGSFVEAFRMAALELGLGTEPDLNAILRMPGALIASPVTGDSQALENSVLEELAIAIGELDLMREREGQELTRELRMRMHKLAIVNEEIETLRGQVLRGYHEKLKSRIAELVGKYIEPERIAQESALLAERSDIQEEVVRLRTHIDHFVELLDVGGEVGKKLDFLLQELNREANTLLSKTAGLSGDGLRITELGLEMKSEIEKSREQIQNLE